MFEYTTILDSTSATALNRCHRLYHKIYDTLWAPSNTLVASMEASYRRNPDAPNDVQIASLLAMLQGLGWLDYLNSQIKSFEAEKVFTDDLSSYLKSHWDEILQKVGKEIKIDDLVDQLRTLVTEYAPRCTGPKVVIDGKDEYPFPHNASPMVFISPYHPNFIGIKPQYRCSLYEDGGCNHGIGFKEALPIISDISKPFPAPLPEPLAQLVGAWAESHGVTIQYLNGQIRPLGKGEVVVGKITADNIDAENKWDIYPGLSKEPPPVEKVPEVEEEEVPPALMEEKDEEKEDEELEEEDLNDLKEEVERGQTQLHGYIKLPDPPMKGQYRGSSLSGETHMFGRVAADGLFGTANLPLGKWDIEAGHTINIKDPERFSIWVWNYILKGDRNVRKPPFEEAKDLALRSGFTIDSKGNLIDPFRKWVTLKYVDGKPTADIKTKLPVPNPQGTDLESQYEWQEYAVDRWVNADNGWCVHPGREYNGIVEACTGSGKTKFVIKAIDKLFRDKSNENISVTIMCPASVEVANQWYCVLQNHGLPGVRLFKPEEIAIFGGFLGEAHSGLAGERKLVNIYVVNTASGEGKVQKDDDEDEEGPENEEEEEQEEEDPEAQLLQYWFSEKPATAATLFADQVQNDLNEKLTHLAIENGTLVEGNPQDDDKNELTAHNLKKKAAEAGVLISNFLIEQGCLSQEDVDNFHAKNTHFLICDEVHRYSPRAKMFSKIFETRFDYSLLVTGTMLVGDYQEVNCARCNATEFFPLTTGYAKAADRIAKERCQYFDFEVIEKERVFTCKQCRSFSIDGSGVVTVIDHSYLEFYVQNSGPLIVSYSYPQALWKKNIANFRIWFIQAPLTTIEKAGDRAYKKFKEEGFHLEEGQLTESQLKMWEKLQRVVSKRRIHELVRLISFCTEKDLKTITFNREINPIKVAHRYLVNKASAGIRGKNEIAKKEMAVERAKLGAYHTRMAGYYGKDPVIGKFAIDPAWLDLARIKLNIESIDVIREKLFDKDKDIICTACGEEFSPSLDMCPKCDIPIEIVPDIRSYVEMPVPHIFAQLKKPATGKKGKLLGDNRLEVEILPHTPGALVGVPKGKYPLNGMVMLLHPSQIENLSKLALLEARIDVMKEDHAKLAGKPYGKAKRGRKKKIAGPRRQIPTEKLKELDQQIKLLELEAKALRSLIKKNQESVKKIRYEVIGDPIDGKIALYSITKKDKAVVDYHLENDYPVGTQLILKQMPCIRFLHQEYMEEFRIPTGRGGSVRTILSGKALVEGIDVPDADIGISIGPLAKKNPIPNLQSLGRVLRPRVKIAKDGKKIPVVKDFILFYVPGSGKGEDGEAVSLFERALKLADENNPSGAWVCEGGAPHDILCSEFFSNFNKYYQGAVFQQLGGIVSHDGDEERSGFGYLTDIEADFTKKDEQGEPLLKNGYIVSLLLNPQYPEWGGRQYRVKDFDKNVITLPTFDSDDIDFMNQYNSSDTRGYTIEWDFPVAELEINELTLQVASELSEEAYGYINPVGYQVYQARSAIYQERLMQLEKDHEDGTLQQRLYASDIGDFDYGLYDDNGRWERFTLDECYDVQKIEIEGLDKKAFGDFREKSRAIVGKLRLYEIHNPAVIKRVLNAPDLSKTSEVYKTNYCNIMKAKQSGDPLVMDKLMKDLGVPILSRSCENILGGRSAAWEMIGKFIYTCFDNGCQSRRGRKSHPNKTLGAALKEVRDKVDESIKEGNFIQCVITEEDSQAIYCASEGNTGWCASHRDKHNNLLPFGHLLVPPMVERENLYVVVSGNTMKAQRMKLQKMGKSAQVACAPHGVYDNLDSAKIAALLVNEHARVFGCEVEIHHYRDNEGNYDIVAEYPRDAAKDAKKYKVKPEPKPESKQQLSSEPYTLWKDKKLSDPLCNKEGKQAGYSTKEKALEVVDKLRNAKIEVYLKFTGMSTKPYTLWYDKEFTDPVVSKSGEQAGYDDLAKATEIVGKLTAHLKKSVYIKKS